ncbi:two-component system, chemotaxis family, sensor kinase CheA [Proteiniborus sp. DW1]|uniref:chemotaxis protein CheA n=1 Tax=Proteiniborus sp. DW1 TaxID=1889883 RepID=UPI00092E1030|nr:chemotaxis protein CheA [Proteiniborus sp. DW1]SCG83428.1 two-component system, chemotaxis family, sensor kinase CheA [Proteiniborus sp. DW1]
MDMNQYLDMFIEESKEHLQFLNDHLLNLEKNPDDKDLINEIFRIAHTIKGMSGTMGFNKIANLTHEMENLLDAVRSDKLSICSEIVDLLFSCFDVLDDHISNIVSNGKEGEQDDTALIQQLNDKLNCRNLEPDRNSAANKDKHVKLDLDEYVINAIKKANSEGMDAYNIVVKLSDNCLLKSARAFIVFNTLESYSEIVYSSPSTEDIEDEKFDKKFTVVLVTKKSKEEIKNDVLMISEVEKVEVEEIIFEPSGVAEDTSIDVGSHETLATSNEYNSDINLESKKLTNEKKKTTTNIIGKTVRVDIDRLDNLMNLVSELIIIKTRLEDTGNVERSNLNETIEYLERITTSLHDAVMKVRMVPIERVFNRFPRMVRDLAKELGKEIELEMSGEETEVDRTIIDEIGDPLIHLIRNSLDHGIEDPETRRERGKPTVGKIILKAYPDGNNVVIELEDDGAGINVEKVKKKAVDKGLLTQSEASDLTINEAVNLLFMPGFSTAESVSDVSGRGVGLDVVKNKIESINGIVEVETSQYKGSKFSIRLPLTLAIIPALLINLKEEIYALPLSSIREITPVKMSEIRKIQNQEVVLFRNSTLPIIRLNRVLGIQDSTEFDETTMVVVKKGDKEAGLIVDKLIGQQEIVIKSLGKFLLGIPYLAGATILGNGQISLILDVNSLF